MTGNPMPEWLVPTLWALAIAAWFFACVFIGYVVYGKLRHRDKQKNQAIPDAAPAIQMPSAAEELPVYDDWLARFAALVDHAGTIARCSPAPALADAGRTLGAMSEQTEELRSLWKVKRWPQDPLHIEGVRRAFQAVEYVLSLSATTFADEFHDDEHKELETSWSAATLELMDELRDLKATFAEQVPDPTA